MNSHPYDPLSRIDPLYLRGDGDSRVVSSNERRVLAEVWQTPGRSRAAFRTRLNLAQQSIHRIVTQLEERGMVQLGELVPPANKGKPSPRLHLNPRFACSVGVSINTDSAGICVMDFSGGFTSRSVSIDALTMDEAIDVTESEISGLLEARGFRWEDVFGIGFAITGFLVEGTRFNAPEPLSEWSAVHLGPLLANRFEKPVWTENGANTSALCERMLGVGRSVDNFVYLSFNYGFGGGIILNGELARGGFGNAGELSGMFTAEEMGDRPRLRSLLKMLQESGVDVRTIDDLTQRFDMAWPGVADWLDRVSAHYSRVINVLSAVVDPEVIVLGGQIPRQLAEELMERTMFYETPRHGVHRKMPRLHASEIHGETAAIGAASLPLKEVFF